MNAMSEFSFVATSQVLLESAALAHAAAIERDDFAP
jgi:hypothetical protein